VVERRLAISNVMEFENTPRHPSAGAAARSPNLLSQAERQGDVDDMQRVGVETQRRDKSAEKARCRGLRSLPFWYCTILARATTQGS
jgi:hypothetical protein